MESVVDEFTRNQMVHARLDHLSRGLLNDVSGFRHDGWYVRNCTSPHFVSHTVDADTNIPRDDLLAFFRMARDHINRHAGEIDFSTRLQVEDCIIELDKEGRRATVWLTVHFDGDTMATFKGIARESVVRLRWRRMKGRRWICFRSTSIGGPGSMLATLAV
jgi:hypothetical protein